MITLDRESCGYIVTDVKTGEDVFFQLDWDFPGLARTFGWVMAGKDCEHEMTDGTIRCERCGKTPTEFISEAIDFLDSNTGAVAEDPGYLG